MAFELDEKGTRLDRAMKKAVREDQKTRDSLTPKRKRGGRAKGTLIDVTERPGISPRRPNGLSPTEAAAKELEELF